MKKLIYLIAIIAAFALIIPGCIPVVPPAEQDEPGTLPNKSPDLDVPSALYPTIQAAIDAASPGETIIVAAGIYPERLNISKSLSIIGESKESVTINASSSLPGYGISVTAADTVTLMNFTLKGPPNPDNGYGIHTSGCNNVIFENLLVENSGRSGVDFIGCNTITINNIEAKNNGGAGIVITDSNNVTVSNITTSGNIWAGMAVFTSGKHYPGGCDNIVLTGDNSFWESGPFYTETGNYGGSATDPDYPITNLNVSKDFKYILRFPISGPHKTAFFRTLDDALSAGAYFVSIGAEDAVVNDVIIETPLDDYGTYYVGPVMIIQSAINDACSGNTIIVAAGTYTNDILSGSTYPAGYRITKSVTLLGAQAGNDPAGSTDRIGESILVRTNGLPYSLYASGITIDGFMIGSSDPNTGGRLIISKDNTIIRNCIIQNTPSGSSGHGVYIYPEANNALVEYNTFYNTAWEAIASTGASNAVITHNYISASGVHAIQWMGHAGSNNEISYNHISGVSGVNAIQYWGGPGANISYNVIDGGNTMFDGIWLDSAADGSTVSNNQIFDTIYAGINVRGGCTNAVITYNDISGCGTGVDVVGTVTGTVINFNEIYGNGMGVANYYTTDVIDATCNQWGAASGPYHSTNSSGMGNAVSDYVDFDPWLGDPVFEPITINPVAFGTETKLTAFFTGPTGRTATIKWGDSNIDDPATVNDFEGTITGSHIYASTGVYTVTVTLTITNECISNPITATEIQFAAVYDPSEGFVTGGGWIYSPAEAYISNPTAEGKASFGFVSKYKKGQSTPTGNTEFQFKAGDLNFHSDSYDWLVITGGEKAMYKGTGTINDAGNYGFMLTAIDSDPDMFRIKIWDKGTDNLIYDNQKDDGDDAEPTTAIGGGQIVIHKK